MIWGMMIPLNLRILYFHQWHIGGPCEEDILAQARALGACLGTSQEKQTGLNLGPCLRNQIGP